MRREVLGSRVFLRRSNVGGSRPEVPLWNLGSSIRSLPPIARGFGKNALGRVTFIGELEPPGLDSNPSGGLMLRKLLILRNSKMEKNHKNAEVRYTAGTRNDRRLWQ